ncbi:class I SAM-dependent methyltransferase [Bradyrhizobium jicamae]|uniref:Class I SAM-dependent methyltransferase n=1 Tax=Bradyrhizobium jicamae TaxID=280332 RepID=A0ABS5FWN2_9BRAD|nr:class I SAM-dependent methyltransferase [Bradyrhizobium jicamae]MBR0801197.1 class I SAM-dependent methyltransferase [Bradyrhizobium jicamae]
MAHTLDQNAIDKNNAAFWDELCGSSLAKSLDITDSSPASLKRFDDWYFAYYPYLFTYIPFKQLNGKDVLEVGLGYGTVSQRIAESGARYQGLDIASGPVSMVNDRLRQSNLRGSAQQGSILAAPFLDERFDYVVAIGCLHHTGDLRKAIGECRRILRPGGQLIFMVYYAYSYRRLFSETTDTLRYLAQEILGYRGPVAASKASQRKAYDSSESGEAAPHTDWISVRSARSYCRDFKSFTATPDNIDNGIPFKWSGPREELLKGPYPKWVGLDLYATATK